MKLHVILQLKQEGVIVHLESVFELIKLPAFSCCTIQQSRRVWKDHNTLKVIFMFCYFQFETKKKQSQTKLIVLHPAGLSDSSDDSFLMQLSNSETRKLERIQ